MAGEAEHEDDELFEPTEELEGEGQEGQDQDGEGEEPETDEEETFIGFGEDDPGEQDEAGLVPHLRAELRERNKRIRELETTRPKPEPVDPGPEPDIEEFAYDQAEWRTAWDAWRERKTAAEAADEQANQPAQAVQEEFRSALDRFSTQKVALKVKDYADAETEVATTLKPDQLAAIIATAKNSAAVIYALGKHPDRLAALKAIGNPLKLAYAVAELEKDLKVTTKKRAVEPEGIVRGSASTSAGKDKHEDRLAREADRTGDRTKLIAYRKSRNQGSR